MIRAVFLALVLATPAAAQLRGPALGAASRFGQGWRPDLLAAAQALGVRNLRDAVYWSAVERGGRYVFDRPTTTWPDHIGDMSLSLTVNNGHPGYDGGATPHSAAAVAAFARDAAATAARFAAIDAVEVGNEFNSGNFVSGAVKDGGLAARPGFYMALLKATHDAVKAARPDVRILGGGVHSVPAGYLSRLFALGAGGYMDALALHPYSTPPEQFARQIAALRQIVPGMATMPIEVTEFGTSDAALAPGYFLRDYCQMALSGVIRAVWYPLAPRGDGLVPLVDAKGTPTPVGRAFATAQRLFAGQPVEDASPDPFTYACRFGDRALVIWGAPRALTLPRADLRATDATGATLPAPLMLSEAAPIIVTGSRAFTLADLTLGPQEVVADSYDQFTYPGGAVSDGFDRFARRGGARIALVMEPGQEAPGRPWTPYLAASGDPMVRLQAGSLLPGGGGAAAVAIVHAFTAPRPMKVTAAVQLSPAARSHDGVVLRVTLNGQVLHEAVVTTATDYRSAPLALRAGDQLAVSVGPGADAAGDVTGYRITLRHDGG